MAFDAGAIEATLTLNRNPFTAGLLAAKKQAEDFGRKKIALTVTAKLDRASLNVVKEQINKAVGKIAVKTSLDRESLKSVQAQINRAVGRIQVRVTLDRESLTRVREQIARTVGRIQVKVTLDRESLAALRARLATLNARMTVRPVIDRDSLLLLRARLEEMSFRINVRANIDRQFVQSLGSVNRGFDEGSESLGRFQKILIAILALLPIMASGFAAAVGLVGALASTLVIAGLGAGAFALVAVPAFKDISAAVAGGAAEIAKLPPGLREAATALQGLKAEYKKLQETTQAVTGIAIANWFNAGRIALSTLQPLVVATSLAFSNAANTAANFFNSPWWQNFVTFLSRAMGPAVDMLFRSIFALIQIVGNLTRAFWDLGGSQIMGMIVSGLEQFAKWTERIGENTTFQAFMEAAKRSLPVVAKFIGEVLEFIFKLVIALEPLGTLVLRVFNMILDAVNKVPPPMLQSIALGFGAIWAAIALGAGAPVALAIGAFAILAVHLADLYGKNEAFRTTLNNLVEDLRARFQPIWDTIVNNFNDKIMPAWNELVRITRDELIPRLREFGAVIEREVWPKLQPMVDTITGQVIPAILGFLGALERIIGFLIDVFGPTVAREMRDTLTVFDGTFQAIAGLLNIFTGVFTGNWDTFTKGITQLTRGFWTIIAGMFGESFDDLKRQVQEWDTWIDSTWTGFWNGIVGFLRGIWDTIGMIFRASLALMRGDVDQAAELIGQAWRKVANFFATPINWVINTVIGPPGGLAGAWNTVMSWIGAPALSVGRPANIPAFNSGGRVRGKGTGTSDENLALVSNGEFIVKESIASRIMPFLEALNGGQAEALRAAASDKAVDDMMMRFAGGGIVGGQAVLNTMRGRPYIWGGGSAAGTDCSGIVAMVQRGMAGEANPYRRIGTTSSMPWGGWTGGLTSALTAGVNGRGGGASHMAGTLAGTNFEARQTGTPIYVGGPARGSGSFPYTYSLSSAGGQYVGGGAGGGAAAPPPVSWWSIVADKVMGLFKGLFGGDIPGAGGVIGEAMNNIPRLLVEKVTGVIKTKLEGMMTAAGTGIAVTAQGLNQNPLSGMGTSDRGAIIPPGASTLFNATGKPEPLTNLDVYERMKPAGLSVEDVLAIIQEHGGTGGGDTYNIQLPDKATVRELADTLSFKKKIVSKGRYSR